MKIYLVGGAVRDKLLGLPIKERDWVVTGATIKDMLSENFRQVGKDFPVFLHPKTNDEYALARVERKIGPGYTGFSFETTQHVTLKEDLLRRDLTINAMAEDENGTLFDPYHGKQDLEQKILRHVSPAFKEDPVRILRIARFLARYTYLGFTIAPETMTLMQEMVKNGEINALVAERVWKELERALCEKNPEEFFITLAQCGALPTLFPELSTHGKGINALSHCKAEHSASVRFAVLLHAIPEHSEQEPKQCINTLCKQYRIPHHFRELALITRVHYQTVFSFLNKDNINATNITDLLYAIDFFRREQRFFDFMQAVEIIALSQNTNQAITPILKLVKKAAASTKKININSILTPELKGDAIAKAIRIARKNQIEAYLNTSFN